MLKSRGVERRGVEAGEQHVHHDGHVQIAVLEPEAGVQPHQPHPELGEDLRQHRLFPRSAAGGG